MDSNRPLVALPNQAFSDAVDQANGQSNLARIIGKTQSAVSKRLRSGKPIWPEDVLKVEDATGISRHDLRPDIYPLESGADGAGSPPASPLLEAGGAPLRNNGARS